MEILNATPIFLENITYIFCIRHNSLDDKLLYFPADHYIAHNKINAVALLHVLLICKK